MIEIIQQRLQSFAGAPTENALKEIIQEVALFGLWRAGYAHGNRLLGRWQLDIRDNFSWASQIHQCIPHLRIRR